ncbi:MAG: 50S ribosomal protein L32e [Thaumarchaeota archaeon]|nr:50S ribosomal protein L32e [Nitrososphaerota archaeon]MDA4135663.1 50S ribosomal protein L32e [Nitrososphaerota archaeon]
MPKKPSKEKDSEAPRLERLLEVRRSVAKQRPEFVRPESWRYVRLHPEWRKPKGLDNKVRKSIKGWPRRVKVGYRGPAPVRGYHSSGHIEVLVYNPEDLSKVVPGKEVVRMGGTVGARKRAAIMKRASELGLRVLNPQGLRVIESKK